MIRLAEFLIRRSHNARGHHGGDCLIVRDDLAYCCCGVRIDERVRVDHKATHRVFPS